MKWRRKGYSENFEEKLPIPFSARYPKSTEIIDSFKYGEALHLEKYNLSNFQQNSSYSQYWETLTVLDRLDFYLADLEGLKLPVLNWLDIGSKTFTYAPALAAVASHLSDDWHITGIELDAYRVREGGFSRKDIAEYYIRDYQHWMAYIAGDVAMHQGQYQVITWFLPFVSLNPLLKWGLPSENFRPRELFSHVYQNLLMPGGYLFIENQGEWEFDEQHQILQPYIDQKLLEVKFSGKLYLSFNVFKYYRYGWLLYKPKLGKKNRNVISIKTKRPVFDIHPE